MVTSTGFGGFSVFYPALTHKNEKKPCVLRPWSVRACLTPERSALPNSDPPETQRPPHAAQAPGRVNLACVDFTQ